MIMQETTVKLIIDAGVDIPKYETLGSAGVDIRASKDCKVPAGKWALIKTGIRAEIPQGYEIQVRSRSGLAFKKGIFVLNSPGTIDSDYRGEIGVVLANFSDEDYDVDEGDRVAQLVLTKVSRANFEAVTLLTETNRGSGGFGSTGRK